MPPDDIEAELAPAETRDSHEAFPRLTADQLEVLQARGQRRPTEVGDIVYRAGEHVSELLVVLSGSVGIVESDPDGDRVVEVHGKESYSASWACSRDSRPCSAPG